MIMGVENKKILLVIVLIIILLISGCTNTRDETEKFKTSTGELRVTAYLNTIITNNSTSSLAVEDQIELSQVEITLTNVDNSNLTYRDEQDLTENQTKVSFKFDDLNLDDKYNINIKVKDKQGHYVYQGREQVIVTNNSFNYSVDELEFLEVKDVVINLHNLPDGVDSAKVSLKTNNINKYTKEIKIDSIADIARLNFSDQNIEVGEYDLNLVLKNKENEVFNETKSEILVLPNQITKIDLDCRLETGKLGVSVIWEPERENPSKVKPKENDTQVSKIKEESKAVTNRFTWQNVTVYYLLIDRFYNANKSNDNFYGRPNIDATGNRTGTFHGGDIVGLTEKIKAGYFDRLGVNVLCISAPYEQIHGFVGEGELGEFAHYAYDGNYTLDYTTIDKNIGEISEFRDFVNAAHQHNIRVLMDVVINHPGDNTIKDMNQYNFGSWVDGVLSNNWSPAKNESWDLKWIRDNLPSYDLGIPPSNYLIKWLTAWVEEFGIDGFRCSEVSHVEKWRWAQLKGEAQLALEKWRNNNPDSPGAMWDEEFWMLGHVEGQGVKKNHYYQDNKISDFDSLLNTTFPTQISVNKIGSIWNDYATKINSNDNLNIVSFISSIDKGLGGVEDKIAAATKLLLSPGGVQIFYGDEINKGNTKKNTDYKYAITADYPWKNQQKHILKHWQKLGQFRKEHPAVAAGEQIKLGVNTYGRIWDQNDDGIIDDKVIIKINVKGKEMIEVGDLFSAGTTVRNYYTGKTAVVSDGKVEFEAVNGLVLIEEDNFNSR